MSKAKSNGEQYYDEHIAPGLGDQLSSWIVGGPGDRRRYPSVRSRDGRDGACESWNVRGGPVQTAGSTGSAQQVVCPRV